MGFHTKWPNGGNNGTRRLQQITAAALRLVAMPIRPFFRLALSGCLGLLSGCITVQNLPSPARDVFTFSFSTASEMQAMAEKAEQSASRRPAPFQKICIEWNEVVTVPDMLTVIEAALRRRRIETQVYAPGAVPGGCVTLVYAATRAWEQDFSYLNYASMALKQGSTTLGKVVYEPRMLGFDRWASTEAKLIFLLDELVSSPPRLP